MTWCNRIRSLRPRPARLLSLLLALPLLLAACTTGTDDRPRRLTISATGLPEHVSVPVWEVTAEPFSVERGPELGSVVSGEASTYSLSGSLSGSLIEIGDFLAADGSRYRPPQRYYTIAALTAELHVPFRRQLFVDTGVWVRSDNITGVPEIRLEPHSDDGFYDEGTQIYVEPVLDRTQRLGYWIVKEGPADPESVRMSDFTSIQPRLRIELSQSLLIIGVVMGQWERLPPVKDKPVAAQPVITIEHLVEGQRVRLLDGTRLVAETIVGKHQFRAALPVPSGSLVKGAFEITAPDGYTVFFDSPRYADLTPGDVFRF